MEKLASDAQLDTAQCQKIATFAFATALAAPVVGLSQAAVKSASAHYMYGLQKAAYRHNKLVDMLRTHVQAPAGA